VTSAVYEPPALLVKSAVVVAGGLNVGVLSMRSEPWLDQWKPPLTYTSLLPFVEDFFIVAAVLPVERRTKRTKRMKRKGKRRRS
jgi:hypothetical protein